jgi:hypothetical protein
MTMIRFALSFVLLTFCLTTFAQIAAVEDQGAATSTYSSGLSELNLLKAILVAESEGKAQLRLSIDAENISNELSQILDVVFGETHAWADPEQVSAMMLNAIKELHEELERTKSELKVFKADLDTMKTNLNTLIDMILSQEFGDRLPKK